MPSLRKTLLATAALVLSIDAYGVCYDSFNAVGNVDRHFAFLKAKFTAVRTYQTSVGGALNLIDAAAKAGLQIAAGVWLRGDDAMFAADVAAVVAGTRRHPTAVTAIFVGNEDIFNGVNASTVIAKIAAVRGAFAAAGVAPPPIGSVETDGHFLANPALAAACDIIGVNIYPFFSPFVTTTTNRIADLDKRYAAVVQAYGAARIRITETGWPSEGSAYMNHFSNLASARDYYHEFDTWVAPRGDGHYYFQFHDVPYKGNYEAHFGLSTDGASWKFDVLPTPAPTPAPTTTTPAPTTTTATPTTTLTTVAPTTTNSPAGAPPPATTTGHKDDSPHADEATASGGTTAAGTKAMATDTTSTSTATGVSLGLVGVFAASITGFVVYRRRLARHSRNMVTDPSGCQLMTYRNAPDATAIL
ncbi:Aste57867_18901 [Aphanomyces stellatus]|uniref:glucan endo-1,3-beta-D-glucosidase n=1 Tax=Aphanomyces stellatus TaxID=120398 RepID=A0A485LC48_9STRA|nr:hypothetical protein As57867_018837 [Aphanomyces stellatus]VFT95633.1 Aste57867_18901 [Aphanomyces stellatus]